VIAARPSSRRSRHAVTLVEVLLVLCLLVVLASIAWPALERPLSNQRLRHSADAVRVLWGRARVEAMSTGQTLVFRYAIEDDRYSIQTYAGPESTDGQSAEGAEASHDYDSDPAFTSGAEPRLPEDVIFLSGDTTVDARAESLALEEAPSVDAGQGWSDPILFYPDGSTSTARVALKNEYDRCIDVSLRGLTGVVTVGEVYSAEER
jgi:hypothetical protein